MSNFVILETPLVVDDLSDALVPDARHGQCWQHLYDSIQVRAWVTPELGGVTLALTGDVSGEQDYIEDSLLFTLDDDRLADFINDLVRLQNRLRGLDTPWPNPADPS